MITFFHSPRCPGCRAVEDALAELTLAHEARELESAGELPEYLPKGMRLPVLEDDGQVFEGRDAILAHLEELAAFKALWEKFQTDACYCDDEGNIL